jgi:hypothetical protein
MPCMCGADDCPNCHPELGRYVGRRWIYFGDMDDDEADEAIEDAEDALYDDADRILAEREEADIARWEP